MKRFFILFLVVNFYNVDASLPGDINNLSLIVHGSLNSKNLREITFTSREDANGRKLLISAGLIESASYYLTYPQGNPELEAVVRTLPDHHDNPLLNKLIQIVTLEIIDRVTIRSNATRIS